jgi:hypothetical protein
MDRKKIEEHLEHNPKSANELDEEKHQQWRIFLINFKNVIGWGGKTYMMPPEKNDNPEKINRFLEWYAKNPYETVEEQYSKSGYDESILLTTVKILPRRSC